MDFNLKMNPKKSLPPAFILMTISVLMVVTSTVTSSSFATPQVSYAQSGNFPSLQHLPATYAVSIIPGAAQRESPNHYSPPSINVPTGTTVAWFNNDYGQPHTVTSGLPNASDAGSVFNSGVMPATANSFFQYTFNKAGEYIYHCKIHPWRMLL